MNDFVNGASTPAWPRDRVSIEGTSLAWLQRCAGRLGLPPIAGVIADDLSEALPWDLQDARYLRNTLAPGSPPVEVSFAEMQPHALRVDLEPWCFGMTPPQRRQRAAAMAVRWAAELFSPVIGREYEQSLDSVCRLPIGQSASFGAYLGATFDGRGLAEVKLYSEWNGGFPDGSPNRLVATARTALATIPGLTPHFASFSCGRSECVPRLYFICREDLPLLALRDVLDAAGLSHKLAELASLLLPLAGVGAILPAGAGVLSFRVAAGVLDCKLEILGRALPVPGRIFAESVRRTLAQRPEIRTAFQHWWTAMEGTGLWPEELNAIGFRLSSTAPAQFGAYLSPKHISKSRFQ